MYIGLARKWRPQKFSELIGQEPIARTLQNAIRLDRVPHALILTGTRGVGKTTTARILAKALNCENSKEFEPCNECSNCKEISGGMCVDVLEVDGASNTKVDEIRELLDNVQYRPQKSKYKIYIIDEVHMLSTHSFNALLKTLEEPPTGVMFIFATTEPQKIPDTIHSRCQRFDFRQISDAQMVKHLRTIIDSEKLKMTDQGLALVARQASGSLRDALSLLDQVIAFCDKDISDQDVASILGLTDRTLITQTLEAFLSHSTQDALTAVGQVFEKGFDPKSYLVEVWSRVRDILVLKAKAEDRSVSATETEMVELKRMASQLAASELERWFDLLKVLIQDVGRSEFPRYLTEVAFMRITREKPNIPLSDLIRRLEAMESRVSSGSPLKAQPAAPMASPPAPMEIATKPSVKSVPTGNRFEALVSAVKSKKPAQASILLQTTQAKIEAGQISLHYEEGSFYANMAKEPDFQHFVTTLAKELFAEEFKMRIETHAKTASQEKPAALDKDRQREALENPVIQRAVSLFDARIEEVKSSK